MKKNNYESLGASATKSGLHRALKGAGVSTGSTLFAQVIGDISGDKSYHSFIHCDGAGTKSIVAYLAYKESGRVDAFAGLAQDALVMNLDDILCLGIPERIIIANAVARNARLIGDDALEVLIARYRTLVEELQGLGIPIELSGGETADCGDVVRTMLVDATVAGRIRRDRIIDNSRIAPGDVIVGLASSGQASYEKSRNSGIASNGLTLARHVLLSKDYMERYPEIVDPALDKKLAYRGPFKLSDKPDGLDHDGSKMSVGEALLSPTRTFAPLLMKIYSALGTEIHGAIHVTGGGLSKVLRFGAGNLYIKDELFDTPPIFRLIAKHGGVPADEMYQVFNMGHRMELYLAQTHVERILGLANEFNIRAKVIGRVEKLDKSDAAVNKVIVRTKEGNFEYGL